MADLIITERSNLVAIANAIRNRTGDTDQMTMGEMVGDIGYIVGGIDTSDATATASEILSEETAYVNGQKVTGTMPNNGVITSSMDGIDVKLVSIPEGYTKGGFVRLDDTIDNEVTTQADLIAQIATALEGKASSGDTDIALQEKTVAPSTSTQTVRPDSAYDGLSKVIVEAVPTATQAVPSITVDASGKITATATQEDGYVIGGTTSSTEQLQTQGAKTITPNTSTQTAVASGVYTTGVVTVGAIPSNYVVPSGTLTITTNGTHDVKNYASATVNIAGSGGGSSETEDIVNGTITSYTNSTMSQIRNGLFMGCPSLTTANFPNCTQIGAYAFESCKKLTNISFPRCATIGNNAFMNCDALKELNLPQCTSMPMSAFTSCDSLQSINLPLCSSMANYAFNYCKVLTDVSIPSCKTLMNSVFSNCYSLSTLSLPAVTSIAQGVFNKCYNLKSLYLTGSSICALSNSNAFSSTPIGGYSASAGTFGSIYIPASLLTSYQTATNWTYFSSRMVGV